MRDGWWLRACVRAARRWPPKRCRIICTGVPIAIPVGRAPSACRERIARRRRGERETRYDPWSSSGRGRWIASPARYTRQRGIPGPSSPCHGYRPSRRPERRCRSRCTAAEGPLAAADLMRQLVYLPQASIVVAETRRLIVGGAVLALRPSVHSGGYVGTIDLLVVDPDHDAERITEALVDELLRSASNKGCTVVETVRPEDPAALARLEGHGLRSGRTAAATHRDGGRSCRTSHLMNLPAVQRARAGRADILDPRSHCGQERRRLR